MSDLVERLRGAGVINVADAHMEDLAEEAATEIEQLQARLDESKKLSQGYYDEAAKGWSRANKAESQLKHSQHMESVWKANAESLADVANKAEARLDNAIDAWREMATINARYSPEFHPAMMSVLKALEVHEAEPCNEQAKKSLDAQMDNPLANFPTVEERGPSHRPDRNEQ